MATCWSGGTSCTRTTSHRFKALGLGLLDLSVGKVATPCAALGFRCKQFNKTLAPRQHCRYTVYILK